MKYKKSSFAWLIESFQLQLFLMCISLAILLAWGLPCSLLSPLGNLIFTPFIVITLTAASLFFIGELLYLPTTPLVWLTEHSTNLWLWLLHRAQGTQWLITSTCPPIWVLCALPLSALVIIQIRYPRRLVQLTWTLLILLVGTIGYLCITTTHKKPIRYRYVQGRNHITIMVNTQGNLIVYDASPTNTQQAAHDWIQYAVRPLIIKNHGTLVIDHLILPHAPNHTHPLRAWYSKSFQINNLYLPSVIKTESQTQDPKLLDSHANALETGPIVHVINHPYYIDNAGSASEFMIAPEKGKKKSGTVWYYPLFLEGQVDKELFTLYAAKHKNTNIKGLS